VHFAAESHVDHSIQDGGPFINTNVLGTYNILEAARRFNARLVYVSTDEIYGDLESWESPSKESDPPNPSNTYAAAKMAGEMMCMAYRRTHGVDVAVTRSSNNYGPYQYPEKLIPKAITYALEKRRFPLHGDGQQVREWIHVDDNARAVELVMRNGNCDVYNIGTEFGLTNLEVVEWINRALGLANYHDMVGDRPGNDRRYAIDTAKIRELGWKPLEPFSEGVADTIRWYKDNRWWWEDKVVPDDWQIVPGEGTRG
jgi:dTDP-glucose 4,6-dehydratase